MFYFHLFSRQLIPFIVFFVFFFVKEQDYIFGAGQIADTMDTSLFQTLSILVHPSFYLTIEDGQFGNSSNPHTQLSVQISNPHRHQHFWSLAENYQCPSRQVLRFHHTFLSKHHGISHTCMLLTPRESSIQKIEGTST